MKIALFTDTFYPEVNGVATSCLNLAHALERRGHQVHVYAPKCKDWENHNEPNFHYLTSAPFVLLKDRNVALPNMIDIAKAVNMKFDVVHTHSEFMMGAFGRYVARATGCPRVHTYHTAWEDYTYYLTHGHGDEMAKKVTRKFSSWWCDRFDRIIAPTDKTRQLLERYGVESEIDVIPSGMELGRFDPSRHSAEEIAQTREECMVKPGERVLLCIGRMSKEKNVEQLMRVFPALRESCPDVRFVVVGEGPLRHTLQEMADKAGVADSVSIVGAKPWEKIDRYYAIGDVFACASHSETQGLTYIEAMASGLCVCAVDDPCLTGVVENGVTGILTGDSDEEFLSGLKLAFSPEGTQIRSRAVKAAEPYSTERFAERVEYCYLKAIASPRRELRDSELDIEKDFDFV